MDSNAISEAAEFAGRRYAVFLEALRGAFSRLSGTRNPGSDRARGLLKREAYSLARVYLEEEGAQILDMIEGAALTGQVSVEIASGAEAGTAMSERVEAHAELLADALEQEIRLQIERDIALLMTALRGMALANALRASPGAAGLRGRGAAAATREGASATLAFEFLDRAGKRWPSERHVRVLFRQAMVLAWNEAALLTAGDVGLPALEIAHPDAAYGLLGELVPVSGEGWEDLRREAFHPQTHAWLRPATQG